MITPIQMHSFQPNNAYNTKKVSKMTSEPFFKGGGITLSKETRVLLDEVKRYYYSIHKLLGKGARNFDLGSDYGNINVWYSSIKFKNVNNKDISILEPLELPGKDVFTIFVKNLNSKKFFQYHTKDGEKLISNYENIKLNKNSNLPVDKEAFVNKLQYKQTPEEILQDNEALQKHLSDILTPLKRFETKLKMRGWLNKAEAASNMVTVNKVLSNSMKSEGHDYAMPNKIKSLLKKSSDIIELMDKKMLRKDSTITRESNPHLKSISNSAAFISKDGTHVSIRKVKGDFVLGKNAEYIRITLENKEGTRYYKIDPKENKYFDNMFNLYNKKGDKFLQDNDIKILKLEDDVNKYLTELIDYAENGRSAEDLAKAKLLGPVYYEEKLERRRRGDKNAFLNYISGPEAEKMKKEHDLLVGLSRTEKNREYHRQYYISKKSAQNSAAEKNNKSD